MLSAYGGKEVSMFGSGKNKVVKDKDYFVLTTLVGASTVADEILKFKELLDVGAITEEEFVAKKKQLLNL